MSTMFQTASPQLQKLDPLKRVNYTYGLVLGVEEFLQSDAYFLAKHQRENRMLHGYGTVCGLEVTRTTTAPLEVQVAPGWAVNPKGQEIYVPQLMCVQANQWLAANLTALQAVFPTAPATLNLCVVLCYRECKTDVVPIPGQPCQTSSTAPSRIADSFELMLCLNPDLSAGAGSPPSSGSNSGGLCEFRPSKDDDGVRAFARLLSEIEGSTNGPFLGQGDVEDLVRGLRTTNSPMPAGSPPSGPPWYVPVSDVSSYMQAAFLVWITEVRPFLGSGSGTGLCCPPQEKCVLLAEVALKLSVAGSQWTATGISIDQSRRPFLVPTSLLQDLAAFRETRPSYGAVAAGYFDMTGKAIGPIYNGLTATKYTALSPTGDYLLAFPEYRNPNGSPPPGNTYIVKGTVQDSSAPGSARATLEFVEFAASSQGDGIVVRVMTGSTPTPVALGGFMVEISEIGGAS